MEILISNNQEDLVVSEESVRNTFQALLDHYQIKCNAVSICLVDKKTIQDLHLRYFNDPSLTDCITFPIDDIEDPYCYLGEVYVCPYTAISYSKDNNEDPYKELTLYLVHTFFHLLNFGDQSEEEKQIMRQKEKEALKMLEYKNFFLKP